MGHVLDMIIGIREFQKSLKEDPSNIMSEFFVIRTKDEFYADL